jgi:hypothetical protein
MEKRRRPRLRHAMLVALGASLAVGCRHDPGHVIDPSAVGTDRARQTAYLTFGVQSESTPYPIAHDRVRDEAALTRFDRDIACFDVKVRTASHVDDGFEQLEPMCEVESGETQVSITGERQELVEYPYTGERESMRYESVKRKGHATMRVTEPVHEVFVVVERGATLCCRTNQSRRVSLVLRNLRFGKGVYAYRQRFTWTVL